MINRIRELLIKHVKSNFNRYFWLFMSFVIGVSAGAFTVNGLSTLQSEELIHYFQGFLQLMEKQKLSSNEIFLISLQNNCSIMAFRSNYNRKSLYFFSYSHKRIHYRI